MEYIKIRKADSNIVPCVVEIPDHPKGIVIVIHGFSSSKECGTYKMLLRRLPEAGYGMIGIELPGHGKEEALQETLRIEVCKNSIEAAENYAAEKYPGILIYYFASSFGAYITGLYISTRKHLGNKAFFRSAAVNMPRLIVKDNPTEEEKKYLEALNEKGYFDANMDLGAPVRITREMYHDLSSADLFEMFNPHRYGENAVAMVHGAKDNVIDPNTAKAFAVKVKLASDEKLVPVVFDIKLFELGLDLGLVGDAENRLHPAFAASVGDELAAPPASQGKVDPVDDDGFARACFARKHGKARAQLQVQLFDQRYVFYHQSFEHIR